jgi:NADH-quinone oxidoreductase subunit N
MNFDLSVPLQLTGALLPDIVLMVGAFILLLWAAWRPDSARHQRQVGVGSIVVALMSLAAVIWYMLEGGTVTEGSIAMDPFRWTVDIVILVGTIAAILLAMEDNERQGIFFAETHVLILLASSGMMILAAARDLMLIFLGIELMSIAVYSLVGINRRSARSAEGALKYFLLGAFSTAFLLYGIALVYGATGSVQLAVIGDRIVELGLGGSPLLLIGIAMLLVGFGFKISSVPFHMYAPDAYEGAPTPVTAYMAATVKAAAFAAFIRVWLEAFPATYPSWQPAVAFLAIATMVLGNAIGLAQRNLKRLLAYSSIAHAGFILVALAAGTVQGATAIVFYLLVYTLATFGAFALVSALTRPGEGTVTTDEVAGLWHERPWMAVGMAVFMLALLGFPVFGGAGFFAKWYVLKAALQAPTPQTTLAIVLVLTSVVSAGYYLYVVMVMFMKDRPADARVVGPMGGLSRSIAVATAVLVLGLGVLPGPLVRLASAGRPQLSERASALAAAGAAPIVPIPMSR